MESEQQASDESTATDRWTLLRDIAVLQVKLIVDGLRDFILVPVSLVAGIISLAGPPDASGNRFYDLLRIGRKSERWINLFGAADRIPAPTDEKDHFPDEDIDALMGRVESFVLNEYKQGDVTKQARQRLDKALETLHRFANRDDVDKSRQR